MRTRSKILSLVMAFVLALSCSATAFAAEPATDAPDFQEIPVVFEESDMQEIPIVFETNDGGIDPQTVGWETEFDLGKSGSIWGCGKTPTFQMWATGGGSTKVVFTIRTAGGVNYTQGPVTANGLIITKRYSVFKGSGEWKFSAYIESGTDTGNIVCHVKQIAE